MRTPGRFFLARGGFQFAFADAVGSAFDQGDVRVMGEAVEESGDAGGVGKDGVPVLERAIRRQQRGVAFVAAVDDFEQQVSGVGIVGQISYFVQA
jgi:hypothetical protein